MVKFAASLLFAGALLVSTAGAQTPPDLQRSSKTDSSRAAPVIAPLGVGTAFNASLDDALDTRKTKAGDPIIAEAAEDVSYQQCLIFPKGTKIVGHVVRVTSGGRGRAGSAIFIQFDKATIKDGQDVILNAGIQALAVGAVAPMPADASKSGNAAVQAVPVVNESAGSSGIERRLGRVYDLPGTEQHTATASDCIFSGAGRTDLKRPVFAREQGRVRSAGFEGVHSDFGRFARDRTAVFQEEHAPECRNAFAAGGPAATYRGLRNEWSFVHRA